MPVSVEMTVLTLLGVEVAKLVPAKHTCYVKAYHIFSLTIFNKHKIFDLGWQRSINYVKSVRLESLQFSLRADFINLKQSNMCRLA